MVQAYVLVQTDAGLAGDLVDRIRGIDGVTRADDVTGPYDVIVHAEAGDIDELGRLVVARIQRLDGIARTLTCPIVQI
ncbi:MULTISPECIES: Lrp/AsnC family transcriptional regulator [Nocardiopsis]|uniref:DNA-binding Lrp family transcriptional regulator n=1 Tax=Nocardiopsis composta TaxID=157465 RepID=A0A7W8QSW2_9ACTN|nr:MULTISPECIES: Lrp/AsnC ligand binding domain-containing protein [Nocardiopsis]MBB5434961.1 DNA-binding Lrp family transcriptional regulator [Nocardiopsis composta]